VAEAGDRRSAHLGLPAQPTAPARARRFVSATLAAWQVEEGDDAVLVVSELVTNALLHARSAMTVRIAEEPDGALRLSVEDASPVPPRTRTFSIESGTGRGLRLLESLAEEWGVEPVEGGKVVWCRIRPGAASAFTGFDVDAVEAL
jgi:anti-sigma regulatory factor (Ser/Thr protein kinase)